MRHKYDIGKTYGLKRLIGLRKSGKNTVADVECVLCGRKSVVRPSSLFAKRNTSCICARGGMTTRNPRLYAIFSNMKYRCNTETAPSYKNYGGRGIGVCEEWDQKNGFEYFEKWAMESGYNDTLTIDRVDEDGWYSPENCRWVPKSENTARSNASRRTQKRKSDRGAYYAIKNGDGDMYIFDNASEFGRLHGISGDVIRRAAHKNTVVCGYLFGFVDDLRKEEPQSTIESPSRE